MTAERKRPRSDQQADVLQGTLDVMVLQTLLLGPSHGYTIARIIQQRSERFPADDLFGDIGVGRTRGQDAADVRSVCRRPIVRVNPPANAWKRRDGVMNAGGAAR